MKIKLCNTLDGLKPLYDEDFDKKKKLKIGHIYEADIKKLRNVAFLRKYFALINCAWGFISEPTREFFSQDVELFRKTVEIASGHCERVYSLSRREWVEQAKSIAFDKMSPDEFADLYERVKDVLFKVFLKDVNVETFLQELVNF